MAFSYIPTQSTNSSIQSSCCHPQSFLTVELTTCHLTFHAPGLSHVSTTTTFQFDCLLTFRATQSWYSSCALSSPPPGSLHILLMMAFNVVGMGSKRAHLHLGTWKTFSPHCLVFSFLGGSIFWLLAVYFHFF